MKKLTAALMIFLTLTCILPSAANASELSVNVVIDSQTLDFPDAKPFVDANGRTQTPASFIGKALGATVVWDGKEQKAVFTKGSSQLVIYIGKSTYSLDGRQMRMDTAAMLKDNRTFVPAKYVAEAFGAQVRWDGGTRTVYIASGAASSQPEEVKDVPDGTVVNSRLEFKDVLKFASMTLQPRVVLQCNNYSDSEYNPNNLGLDGIYRISTSMLISGTSAKMTVNLEYTQGFRLQQALNNQTAESRLSDEDKVVTEKIHQIIAQVITDGMTDNEKELALHDYLVLNSKYDTLNYQQNTLADEAYTPYGLLVNGTGVCQAYAETFNLLLTAVGIDSEVVTGTADGEDHAWNIVKLEDQFYMVDVTWDDPVPDEEGKVSYNYFNLTGSQLAIDHKWDQSRWPTASGTKYNYYAYNNLIVNSYSEFKQLVIDKIQAGQKEIRVYINNYDSNEYKLDFIFDYYQGSVSHTVPESANTAFTIFLK